MPEVALGGKTQVEEDGCDYAAGNEEGFEAVGAYVRNVGYILARIHRRVV